MKTKDIVAIVTSGLVLVIIVMVVLSAKNSKMTLGPEKFLTNSNDGTVWVKYSNEDIGIEFDYPNNLEIFKQEGISFRECEGCPGFIYIKRQSTPSNTLEEAIKNSEYNRHTFSGETTIDNIRSLISNPFDSEKEITDEKTFLVIKNGYLYGIGARWIDLERFRNSVRIY